MAENDDDNASEVSISPTDWIALNAPKPKEVILAKQLVAIEALTMKDTIISATCLPMIFSTAFLPDGLEPNTREVELLNQFYNTPATCNVAGCNVIIRSYPRRLIHNMQAHGFAGSYACGNESCFCLFDSYHSGRVHFAKCHMDRVGPSAKPAQEDDQGVA